MKRIHNIIPALLILAVVLSGCKDEDRIIPTDLPSVDRYDFPQGNNSFDEVYEEILNNNNVMCLYTEFTDSDLTRTWTGNSSNPDLEYEYFTPEENEALANWLHDRIFEPLGSITQGVFKRYVYMPKDYNVRIWLTAEYSYVVRTTLAMDGIDFWIVSPNVGTFMPSAETTMADSTTVLYPAVTLFNTILNQAFTLGNVTLPADFDDGVDFVTATVSYQRKDDEGNYDNFWPRRGFLLGGSTAGLGSISGSNVGTSDRGQGTQFTRFLIGAIYIRHLWSHFEEGGYWEDCPLLKSRFEKLIAHFKTEYNLDLREYGRDLWSPYTDDYEI